MKNTLIILLLFFLICAAPIFTQDTGKTVLKSPVVHHKDSVIVPSDSGFYIRSTDGKSYLKIYGSVRLNGAYDIKGLQSEQTFSTYDISTGSENIGGRFFMSPYQTRLGFITQIITPFGIINTKLESDFLASGNAFRIRHAYAVFRRFLIGQTWSVFGDPGSVPNTVDPDGPNSSVNERTIQLRFFQPPKAKYKWAIAIESPKPDISNPDSTQLEPAYQSYPDVTSMINFGSGWGYVQLSGVFRSISVRNIDESLGILAGYGGLFSGKIDFSKKYAVYFQITAGKGISRYIAGLTGNGQDIVYDEQNKTNVLLAAYGGFLSGSRQWSKSVSTDVTFGLLRIINHDFQPASSFKESYYFSVNTFLNIIKGSTIGLEYDHGRRINKDGSSGRADRISFIGMMNF